MADVSRLVVGLGNPGREYERTRHNIGFLVLDRLAETLGPVDWRSRDGAMYASLGPNILVKPQSFMNDSGVPLQRFAAFYKIPLERMLVISDDLDLPFGKLRMRQAGGHGGHNGLRSIITHLGEQFPRLRIGIGRSHSVSDGAVISRVLGRFNDEEELALPPILAKALEGIQVWMTGKNDEAMRAINAG